MELNLDVIDLIFDFCNNKSKLNVKLINSYFDKRYTITSEKIQLYSKRKIKRKRGTQSYLNIKSYVVNGIYFHYWTRGRWFRLFYNNQSYGRFRGQKPKQAAQKAFKRFIKQYQDDGNLFITNKFYNFSIIECTRKSKHKFYHYVGKRIELDKPKIVYIHGSPVIYKYETIVNKRNPIIIWKINYN